MANPAFKIIITIPVGPTSSLGGAAYLTDQEIITTLEADLLDILASEGVTMEVVRI